MLLGLIIGIGWMACAFAATGIEFAHLRERFPSLAEEEWRRDLGSAALMGLIGGPFSLVVVFFLTGFAESGWRIRLESSRVGCEISDRYSACSFKSKGKGIES